MSKLGMAGTYEGGALKAKGKTPQKKSRMATGQLGRNAFADLRAVKARSWLFSIRSRHFVSNGWTAFGLHSAIQATLTLRCQRNLQYCRPLIGA
jgi:hypothetical protein